MKYWKETADLKRKKNFSPPHFHNFSPTQCQGTVLCCKYFSSSNFTIVQILGKESTALCFWVFHSFVFSYKGVRWCEFGGGKGRRSKRHSFLPLFLPVNVTCPQKKGCSSLPPSFSPLNPSPLNFLATFRFTVFGGMTSLFIYSKTPPSFCPPFFFSLYTLSPVVCNVHGEEEESRGVGTAKRALCWGMDGPELRSIRASAG